MISSRDLKEVVDRLTGEQKLTDEDMQQLIDNVRHHRRETWRCKDSVEVKVLIINSSK